MLVSGAIFPNFLLKTYKNFDRRISLSPNSLTISATATLIGRLAIAI
jgi:hypothetical protein